MYKEKRNILLTIFLFLQIGVVAILSHYPSFIDRYYAKGIYPLISGMLRFLFGWIPFSMGDLFYGFLIILTLRFLIQLFTSKTRKKRSIILQFTAGLSLFYFCFYLFWGLNYSRSSLFATLLLEEEKFEIGQLEAVTDKILSQTVLLQNKLVQHDSLAVEVPYSKEQIIQFTQTGYKNLGEHIPSLVYNRPSVKKSLFSLPLTYMGFSGYLNPFTGEAQVDHLIPKISLPFTCSHEVAHQLGIASENEANFVGFLASMHHKDPYFQYSACLLILRYALFDIHRYSPERFEVYRSRIPKGVLKNFKETDEFWRSYENPFEPIFKTFYDQYLKYNQQKDGLQSYNQVMGLLISYDNKYSLNFN